MDTELLKTFLEVNRTRHFGKAATNLFITQSAVSARVRQLEQTVGMQLFSRAQNKVQLTAAGERLVGHAETILDAWNRARQEVVLAEGERRGLIFGGLPSLCDFFLPDWLSTAYRYLSDLALSVEVLELEVIWRRLGDGSLDLGFVFEPPRQYELQVEEIAAVPLLMVSSRPGIGVDAALARGYVLVNWGASFASAHARLFPSLPTPILRLESGRAAHELLLHQGGAAYLPFPLLKQDLRRGRLYRVKDAPLIEQRAYAVFRRGDENQGLLRRLLVLLKQARGRARSGSAPASS